MHTESKVIKKFISFLYLKFLLNISITFQCETNRNRSIHNSVRLEFSIPDAHHISHISVHKMLIKELKILSESIILCFYDTMMI